MQTPLNKFDDWRKAREDVKQKRMAGGTAALNKAKAGKGKATKDHSIDLIDEIVAKGVLKVQRLSTEMCKGTKQKYDRKGRSSLWRTRMRS